jgi:hypothetical protein
MPWTCAIAEILSAPIPNRASTLAPPVALTASSRAVARSRNLPKWKSPTFKPTAARAIFSQFHRNGQPARSVDEVWYGQGGQGSDGAR